MLRKVWQPREPVCFFCTGFVLTKSNPLCCGSVFFLARSKSASASPCMSELLANNWQAWAFGVCRRARSIRNPTRMHRRLLKKLRRRGRSSLAGTARSKPLEIWFQDEARVGQQGTLTRIWAERGTRPRAPRDTRYIWSYIFGAVCPERAEATALIMPHADTQAMSASRRDR